MSDDDETKPDLTRIEDLSDFLHEEDPDADAQLDIPETPNEESESEESFKAMSFGDLEDAPPSFDSSEEEVGVESLPSFNSDEISVSDTTEPNLNMPSDFMPEAQSFSSDEEDISLDNEQKLEEEEETQLFETIDQEQNDQDLEDKDVIFSDQAEANDFEETANEKEVAPMPDSFDSPEQQEEQTLPTAREAFQEVKDFGNAITYGQVTVGGNPPFSIILRRLKFLEDGQRIIEILREHGLCDESNEKDYQQGLSNGSMIISQLSEYSAIYLAHKFRRFHLEALVGLSDEIHPSKSYDMDYRGLIRKESITQNKSENISLEDQVIEVKAILLSTTPTLENYRIERYLGLVSTHIMVDESEFQKLQDVEISDNQVTSDQLLEELYQSLAEALKVKAFKLAANAVIGINYQITPLINQSAVAQTPSIRYKISCTGNAVWTQGREAPKSEA